MVGIAITPLTEDMVIMEPPRPCDQQQQGMRQSTQHGRSNSRKHSTAASKAALHMHISMRLQDGGR